MDRKTCDFIVLGAGVAGLSLAYRLTKAGRSVLVLEKDKRVGGLAKTLNINGFFFDYCAHRFHSANPLLMQEVKEIMSPNFVQHRQKSRIHIFNKYLKYPFQLQNLLRAMPNRDALLCGMDFCWNIMTRCFRKKEIRSYADWFCHHFGRKFYTFMCYPYTRKIWGMDPQLLSADWADQRFGGPDIPRFIRTVIKKILTFDFSSFSLEDQKILPDSGLFYYPVHGGIQAMPDRLAKLTQEQGGVVITGCQISSIRATSRTVTFTHNGSASQACALSGLISTIPLHVVTELLEESVPSVVTESLSRLRYMDIIFVFLFINKESVSNDTWLYFPDKNIAFNRAVEFKNWALDMAPPGKTSLCLDITVTPENRNFWDIPEEDLIQKCKKDCEDLGLCSVREVFDAKVVRVPHAYPVYDLEYRSKLDCIIRFIEGFFGVYCLGRTGVFRYNNSDNSIEMGFELAKRLLDSSTEEASIRSYRYSGVSL